jgi:hypothetical protein
MPVISRFQLPSSRASCDAQYQGFIGFKSRAKPFTKEQAAVIAIRTAKFFRGHARFFSRTLISTN